MCGFTEGPQIPYKHLSQKGRAGGRIQIGKMTPFVRSRSSLIGIRRLCASPFVLTLYLPTICIPML